MIPSALFRLAQLRAEDVLIEAAHERRLRGMSSDDRSRVVVAAAVFAAIITLVAAALMLRSILILGGFAAT
jgi:hypothetical protein